MPCSAPPTRSAPARGRSEPAAERVRDRGPASRARRARRAGRAGAGAARRTFLRPGGRGRSAAGADGGNCPCSRGGRASARRDLPCAVARPLWIRRRQVDFSAREAELLEALELVRGREQMTLRVFGEAPPADRRSGTAYLESLRRSRSLPELDPLRAALEPLVRAERTEVHRGPLLASVYHLIDRGRAPE